MVNSAILLKFSLESSIDCKSLIFTELTGLYSLANIPGWDGGVNPAISTALTAVLDITLQDGTVVSIDMYDTFPSSNTQVPTWNILNTDLGYSADDSIPSQVISAVYTVTGNDGGGIGTYSMTTTQQLPVLCTLQCCVNKMAASYKLCKCSGDCSCGNSQFTDSWNILEAIKDSFKCVPPQIQRAKDLIEDLTNICNKTGCGCC